MFGRDFKRAEDYSSVVAHNIGDNTALLARDTTTELVRHIKTLY
jgi:hypothetical protein